MSPPPRNIELERLVIDALTSADDADARTEAWAVYADWLLSVGEPVGEWLAASLRADAAGEAAAPVRARLGEIESATRFRLIDLELADLSEVPELERIAEFTWERGFITSAVIRCSMFRAWDSELLHHTPDRLLDVVLRSPSARMLHTLELDRARFDAVGSRFASFTELLAALPGPLALRRLVLGEGQDLLQLTPALSSKMPELVELELRASDSELSAPLEHPQLRELKWIARRLDAASLAALGASRFAGLEQLELWFTQVDTQVDVHGEQLEQLESLWSSACTPALRSLDLELGNHAAAVVRGLSSGALLGQLERLVLGGVDEEAARAILAASQRFARLPHCALGLVGASRGLRGELSQHGLSSWFERE